MSVDALFDEFVPKQKKLCIVAKWSQSLSETDQEKFAAALRRSDIPHTAIVDWAKARASNFGRDSLRIHRLGECACNE